MSELVDEPRRRYVCQNDGVSYLPEENAAYLADRYAKQRAYFFSIVGEVCAQCGSAEDLQFDHIDPTQKSFDVGALWPVKKVPRVLKELEKCQTLCGPCHRAKTAQEHSEAREGTFKHGTIYAFMKKGCRCEVCGPAHRAWHDARNAKRRTGARGPYRRRSGETGETQRPQTAPASGHEGSTPSSGMGSVRTGAPDRA